jgi:hypothetical protein
MPARVPESVVRPEETARGSYYWHEVIGCAVHGIDGAELGTVKDIYRIGETEVFTVDGGPYGSFDLPAVRAFIRIFAPRRGEIVVDAESLDLRPRRSREPDPDRPKAPRRRTRSRAAAGTATPPDAPAPTYDLETRSHLFPAMFEGPLAQSIPASRQGLASIRTTTSASGDGRHRSVTTPMAGEWDDPASRAGGRSPGRPSPADWSHPARPGR